MLRTSLRSVRALGRGPLAVNAGRQWQAGALQRRRFADEKKPDPSKPAVLPASETNTAARSDLPKSPIPADNVPLTPPEPAQVKPLPESATTPPPPSPAAPIAVKKKKGFFRRLRNLILTLSILGALSFGGGVWYSRVNDNFHDFFTEYVPFGEQAVLYFEEMDFRKRFPNISNRISKPRDTGAQVKIPAQSGASWRVADGGEPAGRQSSAVDKAQAAKAAAAAAVVNSKEAAKPVEEKKTAEPPKKVEVKSELAPNVPAPEPSPVKEVSPVKSKKPAAAAAADFKAPEVDEPSKFPPIAPIDPLKVNSSMEPVVQDLVRMLNDVILVINADGAHSRYGPTISKAKAELNKVGSKIVDMKAAVEKDAAQEVRSKIDDFDKAASDLVSRVEAAMVAQETQWRHEFEEEMKKVRESYDERVKLVMEREKQLSEERLNNKLLEQALALKKDFVSDLKKQVEEERDGRLGKLNDLSSAVTELEQLTTGWNDVVDTNLRTQQLHVAVEAVRGSLENTNHPKPFIRELIALKEIASDDAVVNAAIASINPSAYQRGLSTSSQLIDRFRRVASEVRKASLLPDEAGVASHASSWLLSKVLFKKQGLAAGDDVESILTRTQTYLEEGDLDSAAREMNGLTGWAKMLSKDWMNEVRKVLEVQQALDVIATEARLESLKVE